ncbi:radical SAM/SPASM domain-containing protein [Sphingomonas sp.]|jgi:hypothetical protein|uniref:radical SAM/SPASM domain-containing protein n=1 Tax=Sphingomonas sp. TaxID=28214 RepID=UPI002ED8EBFD
MSFITASTLETDQDASSVAPEVEGADLALLDVRCDVLTKLAAQSIGADDPELQQILAELVAGVFQTLANDSTSSEVYRIIRRVPAQHAQLACDLMIASFLGGTEAELSQLTSLATVVFAGFLTAAGRGEEALTLLFAVLPDGQLPAFEAAMFAAQCNALSISGIRDLWMTTGPMPATETTACKMIDTRELNVDAHRALVRAVAEEGRYEEALNYLGVALMLPLSAGEKMPLAGELATLCVVASALGRGALFDTRRTDMALKANPEVTARALSIMNKRDAPLVRIVDKAVVATAAKFLHSFTNPLDSARRSPYPMRDGKPHVDTVWLEVTNFCNQKCTFCPDMHREDDSQWLPLAEVKRLIDELAATVSVGSMQLNAYGEPLLHPNIKEILAYIRAKNLPWPTFFTSHGLTLVPKKLAQLSHNYPAGIAISLHNDSQESYEATRSAKIGDYETLVARVTALLRQMANEGAPCHMRLYQMVANGNEDWRVDPKVRGAFPDTPARMEKHVRAWEAIAAAIAADAPPAVQARAFVNSPELITETFFTADQGDGIHLKILDWRSQNGTIESAFISARPVASYANLLLEYHPDWEMERRVVNRNTCGFVAFPSLAIFATRKLGICCLDLNSTGTFGSLDDYDSLADALTSPEAARMFAEVANGISTSPGCQICLGEGRQLCATDRAMTAGILVEIPAEVAVTATL